MVGGTGSVRGKDEFGGGVNMWFVSVMHRSAPSVSMRLIRFVERILHLWRVLTVLQRPLEPVRLVDVLP